MPGANRIVSRLDKMITDAINGDFVENVYDETELSRLECRFRQYLTGTEMTEEKVRRERSAIKELVTDISHQTKTPIANICLYTQLLEEISSPEMLPYVRQIRLQTEKLQFLIQNLTKISRLESDIIKLRPVMQPVGPLLEGAIREARGRADAKGIRIRLAGQEEADAAYDPRWTGEALGNVLDNAVKYSPVGSLVTVSVKALEMFVRIQVEDAGMGIPEEERAQIFERFYRGRNAAEEEGNGVGLYLTRMILKRERGYIKVSSGNGGGSCFSIYLPRT